MKRITVAAAACLSLAIPAVAQAEGYFLSKPGAERRARSWAHQTYPGYRTGVFCGPQGGGAPAPGYVYHRWTCGVYFPGMTCGVRLIIAGSSNGNYFYRRLNGNC